MRSSILARIPGFRQRIIPEPHVPSRGSQARGTRLAFDKTAKFVLVSVSHVRRVCLSVCSRVNSDSIDLIRNTPQGIKPARNAGLSSHRPGKLNNSKWPLSKFFPGDDQDQHSSRASSLVTSLCIRSIPLGILHR